MKKRIFFLLLVCMLAVGILLKISAPAGEEKSESEEKQNAGQTAAEGLVTAMDEWTVLCYLCGTDLETKHGMATENLKEIASVLPKDSVNLVLQTGGTKQWHTKDALGFAVAEDKLQRYSYGKEGYQLKEELPLADMASADTLSEFIRWGQERYPARKYMLLLWGHGGGSVSGVIIDELHNENSMALEEFGTALKDGGVSFEAILLDACLMASLETAQTVSPYANYLIASEEAVPGAGTAYGNWLQYLYDTPGCNGEELGRVICDTVQERYEAQGSASAKNLTFSVIDLAAMEQVEDAFAQMMLEMSSLLEEPSEFQYFSYYTRPTERYSGTSMIDLADMAVKAKEGEALTAETAEGMVEAVKEAVVYSVKGEDRSFGHGLSFYYDPIADAETLDAYAHNSTENPEYLAYVDAVNRDWSAPEWVYEKTSQVPEISNEDYLVEMELARAEDGGVQMTVTAGLRAVSAVDYRLYQYDEERDALYELGLNFDVDGDFATGVFSDRFDGMWPAIDGVFCSMELIEQTPTHNRYRIPVIISNQTGSYQMELRAGYEFEVSQSEQAEGTQGEDLLAGTYELYGVWSWTSANNNLPNRDVRDLSYYEGCACAPVFNEEFLQGEFLIDGDTRMEEKELPPGEYIYVFQVTDVFGNTYLSEEIPLLWDGGKAEFVL